MAAAAMTGAALVVGVVLGVVGHSVVSHRVGADGVAGNGVVADGVGADGALSEAVPAPAETPPDPAPRTAETIPALPEPAEALAHAPIDVPRADLRSSPPRAVPTPSSPSDSLSAEMSLVSRAQTALQRGLWSSALSALDEHARRFPRGELAEEREALAIQALARAGRDEEAERRADRFHGRYPRSLLAPVVREALGGSR